MIDSWTDHSIIKYNFYHEKYEAVDDKKIFENADDMIIGNYYSDIFSVAHKKIYQMSAILLELLNCKLLISFSSKVICRMKATLYYKWTCQFVKWLKSKNQLLEPPKKFIIFTVKKPRNFKLVSTYHKHSNQICTKWECS